MNDQWFAVFNALGITEGSYNDRMDIFLESFGGTSGATVTQAQVDAAVAANPDIANAVGLVAKTGDTVPVGSRVFSTDSNSPWVNETAAPIVLTGDTDAGLAADGLTEPSTGGAENVEFSTVAAFPDPSLSSSPEFAWALNETTVGAGDNGGYRKVFDGALFMYEPVGGGSSGSGSLNPTDLIADGIVVQIDGTAENKSYPILDLAHDFTVTELTAKTASGTATVTIDINGTNMTGGTINATSTAASVSVTALNAAVADDTINVVVSSVAAAEDLTVTLNGTRPLQ